MSVGCVLRRALTVSCLAGILGAAHTASADEAEPKKWEQLFFPFPIVGAPPQLEQQAQIFNSYFRGKEGSGDVVSVEMAAIAAAHFGVVATLPFQFGFDGQTTGPGDTQVLAQWLAAGSLRYDNMLSMGVQGSFPTGHKDLSLGDYYVGPFIYGAQRLFHHVILEGNVTALIPLAHGDSAKQILATGMASFLLTPKKFVLPIYAQAELNSTTYLGGTAGLPPGAKDSPAETLFLAPEFFLGPFETPITDGTRIAGGVFFNLYGDKVHAQTYSLTLAIDIPNKWGY